MAEQTIDEWWDRMAARYREQYPLVPPDLPFWSVSCSHLPPFSCWLCRPLPAPPQLSSYSSPLLRLAPDLQLHIFHHLPTLLDVSSLSSTCRSLRSLLQSSPTSILRPVLARSVHAYPDALRAARASALDATWPGCHFDLTTNTYNSPPTASFCANLSAAPATLAETTTLCRLAALVQCLQSVWETSDIMAHEQEPGFITKIPGAPERFHRGCYRLLLMGYLFAGAYIEGLKAGDSGVSRYPMYSNDTAWETQQLLKLVGGFMDWIIADGADRGRANDLCTFQTSWYPDSEDESGSDVPPAETTRTFDGAAHGSLHELGLLFTVIQALPVLLGHHYSTAGKPNPPNARFQDGDQQPTIDIRILQGSYSYTVAVPRLHCIPASKPIVQEPPLPEVTQHLIEIPHDLTLFEIVLEHYFRRKIDESYFEHDNYAVQEFWYDPHFILTGGVTEAQSRAGELATSGWTMWPLVDIW